jgi:hypothetical protein
MVIGVPCILGKVLRQGSKKRLFGLFLVHFSTISAVAWQSLLGTTSQ